MDMVLLTALVREEGASAKVLRESNVVPCVVYGNETQNVSLQCKYSDIFRAYQKAGESTIVDLDAGGKKVPVLFHEVQMDPVSDRITHVDFYAVDMKKEIEAKVPIHLEGEAPAVKDLGGILVTSHDHVTVKCLPANLPHSLTVSIESLIDFQSTLTVAAIDLPEGVTIMDDPEVVIATAQEPRKEEEVVEVAPEGEEGETEEGEGGETEGAEGEEGGKTEGDGKKDSDGDS